MINVELLEATMGRILAEPENWYQAEWATTVREDLSPENVCGTAMCFAGTAVTLAGAVIDFHDEEEASTCIKDGESFFIEDYSMYLLGLTIDQARALFSARNTLDDLQRVVKELVEQAGQTS